MSLPPAAHKNSPEHYFSPQPVKLSFGTQHSHTIKVKNISLQFAVDEGVFSRGGLDTGSRLLLETMLGDKGVAGASTIGDIGCGWGPMGCFLSAHLPRASIFMVDINGRAAGLAALNAQKNNLKNTHVWCGDGLAAIQPNFFDVFACNPPIRAGNQVIGRLFEDAHRCLKTGGSLWIVIRTAQGAKSWQKKLNDLFGNCETKNLASGFRIFQCIK